MANWYSTTFTIMDKDIIEVIKNGKTINLYYEEETGCGHCSLGWGLASVDIGKIREIAAEHKSSFHIISSDWLSNTRQTWEFKDGVEIVAKVEHGVFDMDDLNYDLDDEDVEVLIDDDEDEI